MSRLMQVLEGALSRVVRLDPSLNVFCVVVAEAHVHVMALDKSCYDLRLVFCTEALTPFMKKIE